MSGKKGKREHSQTLNLTNSGARKEDLNDSFQANFDKLTDQVEEQQKMIADLQRKFQEQTSNPNLKYQQQIIHLNNECLHLKNVKRLSCVIFSGVQSTPRSSSQVVKEELQTIMGILNTPNYQLKSSVHIPWGNKFALKCEFSSTSTCGSVLRNSFNLISAGTNHRVRPDLSYDQRQIRTKLKDFGKDLQTEKGAKCTLRSWRYMQVTHKDGSIVFYEADNFSSPMVIDPTQIPYHLKKHLNKPQPVIKPPEISCAQVQVSSNVELQSAQYNQRRAIEEQGREISALSKPHVPLHQGPYANYLQPGPGIPYPPDFIYTQKPRPHEDG